MVSLLMDERRWAEGEPLALRAPALVHHSDRSAQYTSVAYQALLAAHRLRASLSGTGSCYDNAVVESFFHTLTTELLRGRVFTDRASARAAIFEYIEVWYNWERRHSTVSYESPLVSGMALHERTPGLLRNRRSH